MTEKYKEEILKFLSCCLDVMLNCDKNVIVIKQYNPTRGEVFTSLKDYKNHLDVDKYYPGCFIEYRTGLSDESYGILYDNISYWASDRCSIDVIKENTSIRIQLNSKDFSREAIDIDIQNLKQEVMEEHSLTFDEDIAKAKSRASRLKVPEQEIGGTMSNYTMETAEKIIRDFVRPCLGNMTDPDWGEPDVIILPQKRNGLGYTFDDLDCAIRHSIDDPDVSTLDHNIDTDAVYKLIFDNIGKWVKDIPEIKVCYLKNGNLRIRFADDTSFRIREDTVARLEQIIKENVNTGTVDAPLPVIKDKHKEKKGEKKKMNDFSLTNLKDALVNKITHLDRKTVTILAIIALALLVVGKYQDIKDILKGIKDKVKRSKNFKAMVADGTAALDSLKKIVGVKDNKKETADEA